MDEPTRFIGSVEFADSFRPRNEICHVLFDLDGTLSLLRQGWPEVMVPMFVKHLPPQVGESEDELRQLAWDDIMRLNGKQTIYQMIQLTDRIRERGGSPRDPLWYKHEYLRLLDEHIKSRKHALQNNAALASESLVYHARHALQILHERDFILHLASGTDDQAVVEEAELLGIADYFGQRIHGARRLPKLLEKDDH